MRLWFDSLVPDVRSSLRIWIGRQVHHARIVQVLTVEVVAALECDHWLSRFVGQMRELVQCPGKDV
jgi:hypothetical protein